MNTDHLCGRIVYGNFRLRRLLCRAKKTATNLFGARKKEKEKKCCSYRNQQKCFSAIVLNEKKMLLAVFVILRSHDLESEESDVSCARENS